MVRLVDVLVNAGVVLETVNPVDTKIVKDHVQKSGNRQPRPAVLVDIRVQQTVTAHLSKEERQGKKVDNGNGEETRLDLELDLVLEESRVIFETAIKNEVVRKGGGNDIDEGCAEASDQENGSALAVDVVAR